MNTLMRGIAWGISLVFHPLLMVTYMAILLLLINPYAFGVSHIMEKDVLLIKLFFATFLFPSVGLLMLKGLGLIPSVDLPNRQDRIGPYVIAGVFYIYQYVLFSKDFDVPELCTAMVLGATIALFLDFVINIVFKISAHTTGMGGLLAFIALTMYHYGFDGFSLITTESVWRMSLFGLLCGGIIAAGLVGTARLFLKAHEPKEVYWGYLIGILSQVVAYLIVV